MKKKTWLILLFITLPACSYASEYPFAYYWTDITLVGLETVVLLLLGYWGKKGKYGFSKWTLSLFRLWILLSVTLLGFLLVECFRYNTPKDAILIGFMSFSIYWSIVFGCFILPLFALILLIFCLINWNKNSRKSLSIYLISICLFLLTPYYVFHYPPIMGATQWRVWVSNQDLDKIAKALDAYYVDNNAYPPGDPGITYPHETTFHYSEVSSYQIPRLLTTPIAYLVSLPHDQGKNYSRDYYEYGWGKTNNGKWFYIVTAYGDDFRSDIDETSYNPDSPQWSLDALIQLTYDPSNGIASWGDLWRISK